MCSEAASSNSPSAGLHVTVVFSTSCLVRQQQFASVIKLCSLCKQGSMRTEVLLFTRVHDTAVLRFHITSHSQPADVLPQLSPIDAVLFAQKLLPPRQFRVDSRCFDSTPTLPPCFSCTRRRPGRRPCPQAPRPPPHAASRQKQRRGGPRRAAAAPCGVPAAAACTHCERQFSRN